MKKNCLTCILFLLSLFSLATAAESVQFENLIVGKIAVIMANDSEACFDASSVTAKMKTREGDFFSQVDFDNDLKTLAKEFDSIEPQLDFSEGALQITLNVSPKPTIRTISWCGNDKVSTSDLKDELGIAACSLFDRQAFNKAFHKLKAYYVKQGFFEAMLDYTVTPVPETNTVDIAISVYEGRAGRIKDIKFINFTKEEKDAIYEKMMTKKYFLLTSWYTGEGTYNEEAIQQDRLQVLNFLQNEGYADATVDIDVCESEFPNRIVINIIAQRGEPYTFGAFSIEGNCLFSQEQIFSQFTFCENDLYSPDALRQTVERISDFYGRRGYIDVLVEYEPRLNPETRSYSVHFTIEEGAQYRVGTIKVYGNFATQTNVILHETLLVPGEIFNSIKLKLTEERLKNIGYFKNVNVYAVRSEGPGGLGGSYRDLVIEVEETVTGSFGAGFGLSNAEGVFGEFRITERNFNYEGLGCVCQKGMKALRGGGEFVNFSTTIGAKSSKYSLSWTKPYFRDTLWVVGFEVVTSSTRYISNDYDIDASGLTLHGAYPFNPFLRFGVHYRIGNTYVKLNKHRMHKRLAKAEKRVDEAESHKQLENAEHKEEHEFAENQKLREEARNSGLISAFGVSWNYDTTDHPSSPLCGFKSRFEQEFAGFGGDHCFMSLAYLNSYYYPFGERGVLKFRADTRFVVPMFHTRSANVPLNERLFLGGDNTIRGYKVYRLGPQFNDGDPRGGMSLQLLSAEYCWMLNKQATAFLFCDSGHLSFDVFSFGTMWTSVGFGIYLKVLEQAPPVTLGLGFPLNPDHKGDVKRFFFNMGGRF
jgi:outer membrane protein insertion porin family